MAESDTSASSIVRQTRMEYEDMRRKLAETEKKLNRLAKMEAQSQAHVAESTATRSQQEAGRGDGNAQVQTQRNFGDSASQMSVPSASAEDVRSVRSELSTVPGSYTGFASRAFPASTPCKQTLPRGDGQVAADDAYDSDSSGSVHQGSDAGSGTNRNNNSVKLLRQNQRLLSELERLVCELQAAKHREGELCLELEGSQTQNTGLQERMEELQAELEAQDKALRSAEQHLTESQRQVSSAQQESMSCQQQLQDMCSQLDQERKARCSVEAQRDEAVQNFLEAQASLEDFQRRNHERMKKLEESEDHLRDSLAHTNTERDELLQRVDSFQSTVTSHETEIQRLEGLVSVEQETKTEMEAQNLDLRKQLAKLTTRLHKLEEETLQMSVMREENAAMRSEVEENRDAINQLEDIVDNMRRQRVLHQASHLSGLADDSGNCSIHLLGASLHSNALSGKGRNSSRSLLDTRGASAAEGNTNNNGSTISHIIADLRAMLIDMDDEIRRLRSQLTAQEHDQLVVCDLRAELSDLVERAVKGETHTRDLEGVVGKLEADRASLARQVSQQASELESRDSHIITLEARLGQRNAQVIELQEDVNYRCQSVARLEQEIWKKSASISQLEAMLEEKSDEMKETDSQFSIVQLNANALEEEVKVTRQKLKAQQMELERCRATAQQNQATHTTQCRQYERQIEMLQAEAERKDSFSKELQQLAQQAQQDAADKEKLVDQLQDALLKSKEELGQISVQGQDVLQDLERKLLESSKEVQQLQSALLLCRNEISEHIYSMEGTRKKFESELGKREASVERLENQLRALQTECVQRTESSAKLEEKLAERQTALQQCQARITQLERSEASLSENVKQLEVQLLKEKAQWMTEADQLERKLGGQSGDLDTALTKLAEFKQTVKELQEDKRILDGERLLMERALQSEITTNQSHDIRVSRLEKDLRDMRVELEQKVEIVGDLEDTVRNKDADLEQQRSLVEQLDVDKVRMQREMKQLDESKSQLEERVERLNFDNKAKEQILHDTREILRKTQNELSEKSVELSELHGALEERQRELHERVSTMQQLESTIHETHDEMSQRMQRVDSTLHKYETEIKERTSQIYATGASGQDSYICLSEDPRIADLDDRLKDTKRELVDTSRQLQQQQQLARRQQVELQATMAKVDELETTNARQKQQLDEHKHENVEVTQELRLTREQLQTQHAEFLATRRELAAARREAERVARELDMVGATQRSKEQNTARLSGDLGACKARVAQAEAKLAAQTKQMQKDLAQLTEIHRAEMEAVQSSRNEAAGQLSEALDKIEDQAQQMAENERLYRQRLDTARSELEALRNEVSSRKEVLRSANEAIFQKDSEIAHLKAQVSRLERFGMTSQHAPAATSAPHQAGHAQHVTWNPVLHSTSKDQRTDTGGGGLGYSQRPPAGSSQRYFLSSGPHSPLSYHDLSHNNANLNSSHNASELPIKDTWDDKDPQSVDGKEYAADHLIFSFERLGAHFVQTGGEGGVCLTDAKADEFDGEATTLKMSTGPDFGLKSKNDANNDSKKGSSSVGKNQGPSATDKFQAGSARTQSASATKSQPQGQKTGKKKVKLSGNSNGKLHAKKSGSARGEKEDYSHHHQDPETLVGSYQGEEEDSQPVKEMEGLQQQLQANAIRQQEIERQLRTLDNSDDSPSDQ